jgi:hypothetical protein
VIGLGIIRDLLEGRSNGKDQGQLDKKDRLKG